MKNLALLFLTIFHLCGLHAQAQVASAKVNDVVLFSSVARSGRIQSRLIQVMRVGLVIQTHENSLMVQEINYPTRHGQVVYREKPGGEVELYYGHHEVLSGDVIPLVENVVSKTHGLVLRGSSIQIGKARSLFSGKVLYTFSNGTKNYMALTNQAGWTAYQNFGEKCYEQVDIQLRVRFIP